MKEQCTPDKSPGAISGHDGVTGCKQVASCLVSRKAQAAWQAGSNLPKQEMVCLASSKQHAQEGNGLLGEQEAT
jgi:hypothetical protein